ncbi:MAG: RNA polymerase sigma factor [Chloroflexota bacterium]
MVEDWIQRWRSVGDEAAAEALYNHYHLRLFRLAFGLLGNSHEAEDVLQETMKYALENIGRYDASRAHFGTWLQTIAVSRARDRQRRQKIMTNFLTRLFQQPQYDTAPSAERLVMQSQQHGVLIAAIQSLTPAQREVVLLRYWGNHSFPEISQIVGKSEGTVKSRLRLAHQQLQRLVDKPKQRGGSQ